jgi:hypothetical protein
MKFHVSRRYAREGLSKGAAKRGISSLAARAIPKVLKLKKNLRQIVQVVLLPKPDLRAIFIDGYDRLAVVVFYSNNSKSYVAI